jgi:hypothetical protein
MSEVPLHCQGENRWVAAAEPAFSKIGLQEVEIESIRKMLARAADTGHSE